MATVRDIVEIFRSLAAPQADELQLFRKHLGLLNAGQRAFWRVLTSRKQFNNWFVVFSQSTTPAGTDYFAPLANGTREYNLPPNFHHLRAIECLTSGYEYLRFTRGNLETHDFREGRALGSGSPFGGEALYDIIGVNPGRFVLAQHPPVALDARLMYCRVATAFTALGDALTDFPGEAPELIAQWCATKFLLGADFSKWQGFERQWQNDIDQFVFAESRDDTGPSLVEGFLE